MSFDGATRPSPSSLDFEAFEQPHPQPRRRVRKAAHEAATVDNDLAQELMETTGSGLGDVFASDRPFVIEGNKTALKKWMLSTGSAALLEVVANALAQHLHASCVKAVLDIDGDEDEAIERALLLAVVSPDQADAVDRLFDFTASDWWLALTRSTSHTILVDIQRG
jgi:hypothetical protein